MLFNEPKLLKFTGDAHGCWIRVRFSALQRAEIAEMPHFHYPRERTKSFSALQRAEIAEIAAGGDDGA